MGTLSHLLLGAACLAMIPVIHWFLKQDYERYINLVFIESALLFLGIYLLGKAHFLALQGIW